jgi:transposase
VTSRDEAIARLTGRGFSRGEVAQRLNISAKTVQRVMKQPAAQALAERVREQVDPEVSEVLRELLRSPSDAIRLGACRLLLQAPFPLEDPETDPDERPRIQVYTNGA